MSKGDRKKLIRVDQDLARTWPDLLVEMGLGVNLNPKCEPAVTAAMMDLPYGQIHRGIHQVSFWTFSSCMDGIPKPPPEVCCILLVYRAHSEELAQRVTQVLLNAGAQVVQKIPDEITGHGRYCRSCSYDLIASEGRCPECGTPMDEL